MKISNSRWQEAQKFEVNDWLNQPNIVNLELAEAKQKYSKLFAVLEKKLKITSKSKILDVGCSLTCVSLLVKKGIHFGVEPLADKLQIQKKVKKIKVLTGTGENIPFDNKYFDLIICRNVIDHTHGPLQVINEMDRVLKPKGYLFLACYVYHPFIAFIKNLGESLYILRNVGHPHTYNPITFENLIHKKYKKIKKYTIYTGQNPHDFGKAETPADSIPIIQQIILFISKNILKNTWFVKEISILCQKP